MPSKTLFLFTIAFPHEDGETFIQNEFPYLSEAFGKIVIISSANGKKPTDLPAHVLLYSLNDLLKGKNKRSYFLKHFVSISSILASEFKRCSSSKFFLSNLRAYNSLLLNSFICADVISKLPEFKRDAVFYSFWLNNHALTLSVLKKQNKINGFLFRVHGYDLILERWPHNYIAFQHTCHKYADKILTVSKKSLDYFKKTYPTSHKASTSYLGSAEHGINPYPPNEKLITLVSCSNIIPLKRLNLIIDILKCVNVKVEWIHFGDGYLKDSIKKYAVSLPENITYDFKGKVSQKELFDFYASKPVDFFMNVSDSEGLPFTIIEACSFGIPIIATEAGGTAEIVKKETGVLLPIDFKAEEVAKYFNNYNHYPFKNKEFRIGIKNFWKLNFYAEAVYPRFIQEELLHH